MSNRALSWAFSTELPTTPKFILVTLADLADERDSCFPGQEYIATTVGASTRTVSRALVDLERQGYIVRERRARANGSRTSDRYVLKVGTRPVGNKPDDC